MAATDDPIHPAGTRQRFTHEAIVAGLRELSALRGAEGGPARVPKAAWDGWRDPAQLPSSVRLLQRYGSWNEACRQAGVPVVEQTVVSGPSPRWTDAQIAGWVARFLAEAGTGRSYAAYTVWAQARPDAPGAQTVRNRFGSWSAACAAATAAAAAAVAVAVDPVAGAEA